MNRTIVIRGLAVFAGALVVALFAANALVVKVQATQLRAGPQFFAAGIAPLRAGDRLEKLDAASGWIKVRTEAGAVGWVHSSAVEPPRTGILAGGTDMKTQASASEVTLAGKGFNKQVEESYRARNPKADFAWVDRMVQIRAGAAEIEDFLKRGKLAGGTR